MSADAVSRVSLRPFADGDDPLLRPWLAEAVAAVDRARGVGADAPTNLDGLRRWIHARWRDAECAAIVTARGLTGFLIWQAARPPQTGATVHAAVIAALAVRHDARNLGYGAEAVEAVEESVRARQVLAAIPRTNGLAVYFWLRAGYRPVALVEQPDLARDPEHLWMLRAVCSDRSAASPGC